MLSPVSCVYAAFSLKVPLQHLLGFIGLPETLQSRVLGSSFTHCEQYAFRTNNRWIYFPLL